jgi:hypothetical protein
MTLVSCGSPPGAGTNTPIGVEDDPDYLIVVVVEVDPDLDQFT